MQMTLQFQQKFASLNLQTALRLRSLLQNFKRA
jgi:hypothetical protein